MSSPSFGRITIYDRIVEQLHKQALSTAPRQQQITPVPAMTVPDPPRRPRVPVVQQREEPIEPHKEEEKEEIVILDDEEEEKEVVVLNDDDDEKDDDEEEEEEEENEVVIVSIRRRLPSTRVRRRPARFAGVRFPGETRRIKVSALKARIKISLVKQVKRSQI